MRDMLEPVFGESGAVMAQFLITLVIILLVIGLVYWLIRRFAGIHFQGGTHGRAPRLAVIDAVPVDSRRKLVLVRRDNVEHLLLIGGTSDVVVEPAIQRTTTGQRPRQPQAQPAPSQQPADRPAPPQTMQPQPAQPPAPPRFESSGISEPIPFPPQAAGRPLRRAAAPAPVQAPPPPEPAPQRRVATRQMPVQTEPLAAVAAPVARPIAASARFEEPTRPTRIEQVGTRAETVERAIAERARRAVEPTPAPEPEPAPLPPVAEAPATVPPETPATNAEEPVGPESIDRDVSAETPDIGPEPAQAVAMEDNGGPETAETPADESERAATVSDLEKEMARLLGEITARRES